MNKRHKTKAKQSTYMELFGIALPNGLAFITKFIKDRVLSCLIPRHYFQPLDGGDSGAVYDGGGGRMKGTLKIEDEDTDASMASDASSGPSHLHLQQPWEVQEDDGKQEKYKCSSKKNKKAAGTDYNKKSEKKMS
ncbi:hypothetical protein L2E82_48171 [Cichorium intybus]|uniref:Uncharacterized protein n=1 Tax=Cichorium intybus TaxID=13427 RepID=A0ACB8YY99_CICIN|nr:hypothetical protein L2E82_48171 [Cichorium intybus]